MRKSHAAFPRHGVSYAKWGYVFLIPFFVVYTVFSLYPLLSTIWYSFFERYRSGLRIIGPTFVGLKNYAELLGSADFWLCAKNTLILWLMGFVPQLILSLLLAALFTNTRLRLRGQGFFKTVIYLPNIIMASAFAMLFYALFALNGPVNNLLIAWGLLDAANPYQWLSHVWSARGLVALMNFLLWYGNTTILLMAAILGVDPGLYEAAEIDGASGTKQFFFLTLPLIRPILVYVIITSMLGGLQMFDVPQVLTAGDGTPNRSTLSLVMLLNQHLFNKNYGMGGAISVLLFLIAAALSVVVFRCNTRKGDRI